jgi:hypothetical protein
MTSKAKKILPGEEKILPKKVAGAQESAKTKRVAKSRGAQRPLALPKAAGGVAPLAKPGATAERPRPPSIPPERGDGASQERGTSKAKEFRSMKPDRSQAAACRSCGWAGVLGGCAERGMGGDAFSEGWAWHCPHCKAVVEVYAWRQLALIVTSS